MTADQRSLLFKSFLDALVRTLKKPGFWLIVILLVLITIPHYREALEHPVFLTQIMSGLGLNRHAFERILFLVPIILAGYVMGWKGALGVSFVALFIMLPRVFLLTQDSSDSLFESTSIFIVGCLLALAFLALRREKQHGLQLSVLDKMASVVSQSLELKQVLNAAIDGVIRLMHADGAFIYLLDEDRKAMNLAAYKGLSEKFVKGIDGLMLGEGLNGAVALSGKEEYIEDAILDPRLTKTEEVRSENLHSQIIVPLKSRDGVMGTLSIVKRSHYKFSKDEMETALSVGAEIGGAVANARIYEKEKHLSEKLRSSEEKYRNLFENAHDAIWLQDFNNNIITANMACARLTGYSLTELNEVKADDLLCGESVDTLMNIHNDLLATPNAGSISEVKMIKKNGNEVFVQLSTSLLYIDGRPQAFQHVARDITAEKRMQENLHFYLSQVTKAQEEERNRIARELHDDTIQSLVVLARQIDDITYNRKEVSAETKALLDKVRNETNNIMAGVRRLSQDLRPPTLDKLGLIPALEWLVSSIQDLSGIPVRFVVQGKARRLPAETELTLYRIIQEALRNVWRHSHAGEAWVIVEFEDHTARITVHDNGRGMDLSRDTDDLTRSGKLGLAGIKERARLLGGTIDLRSIPGDGTTVMVEVPLD
jgi:PAS domain S-box-containing protein